MSTPVITFDIAVLVSIAGGAVLILGVVTALKRRDYGKEGRGGGIANLVSSALRGDGASNVRKSAAHTAELRKQRSVRFRAVAAGDIAVAKKKWWISLYFINLISFSMCTAWPYISGALSTVWSSQLVYVETYYSWGLLVGLSLAYVILAVIILIKYAYGDLDGPFVSIQRSAFIVVTAALFLGMAVHLMIHWGTESAGFFILFHIIIDMIALGLLARKPKYVPFFMRVWHFFSRLYHNATLGHVDEDMLRSSSHSAMLKSRSSGSHPPRSPPQKPHPHSPGTTPLKLVASEKQLGRAPSLSTLQTPQRRQQSQSTLRLQLTRQQTVHGESASAMQQLRDMYNKSDSSSSRRNGAVTDVDRSVSWNDQDRHARSPIRRSLKSHTHLPTLPPGPQSPPQAPWSDDPMRLSTSSLHDKRQMRTYNTVMDLTSAPGFRLPPIQQQHPGMITRQSSQHIARPSAARGRR